MLEIHLEAGYMCLKTVNSNIDGVVPLKLTYDIRIRNAVATSPNPNLFPELNIPRCIALQKVPRTKRSRKAALVASPALLPYGELRRHFPVNQETEELVAGKSFPFLGNAPKKQLQPVFVCKRLDADRLKMLIG